MSVLLVICAIVAVGCGDDATTNATGNAGMSAKVDGNAWSPGTITAHNASGTLVIGGTEISGANNRQINISVPGATAGNSYQIGGTIGLTFNYIEGSMASVNIFSATSGTVTISEFSSSGAKGSFSVTAAGTNGATGTRTINEGSFNVTF
jgi:hypothetical protein